MLVCYGELRRQEPHLSGWHPVLLLQAIDQRNQLHQTNSSVTIRITLGTVCSTLRIILLYDARGNVIGGYRYHSRDPTGCPVGPCTVGVGCLRDRKRGIPPPSHGDAHPEDAGRLAEPVGASGRSVPARAGQYRDLMAESTSMTSRTATMSMSTKVSIDSSSTHEPCHVVPERQLEGER